MSKKQTSVRSIRSFDNISIQFQFKVGKPFLLIVFENVILKAKIEKFFKAKPSQISRTKNDTLLLACRVSKLKLSDVIYCKVLSIILA